MNLNRVNWIQGYLELQIRGKYVERLLNRMVGQGMHVWNIRRKGTEAYFCISVKDFYQMKPLLKETYCRFHIIKRIGFPFFLHKLRTRSLFLIGVLLFFIGIYTLSFVVWRVEVVGNDKIPDLQIRQAAEKLGIKQGVFVFQLPPMEKIQRELLKQVPNASWVGFEMKGTTAMIKVAEKVLPEEQRPNLRHNHLIATKKAVVYYIFAERGKPLVRVNDVVKPGQILISGILGNEEYSSVDTARGIVEGEVWYESEIEVPLKQNRPILTGDYYKEKYLTIGNWNLKISGYFQTPFNHAIKTEETATVPWIKKYFNLGMKTITYQEDTIHESLINEGEASSLGKRFARENLLKQLDASARIKDEKVLHQRLENGKVYIKIHYIVIENIVKELPFDANQIKDKEGE